MKQVLPTLLGLVAAFAILFISILRTASVTYDFKQESSGLVQPVNPIPHIDYALAKPGTILPGDFLWPLKALRDRIWLFVVVDTSKKADLKLLFADKRIGAAKLLFEREEFELGFATLIKAERYLEEALNEHINAGVGSEDRDTFERLALSALKHIEVVEQMIILAPQDALPKLVEAKSVPTKVYIEAATKLREINAPVPENPFVTD